MKNAFADIQWFMRAIQHQMGGEITQEYKVCQLYYDQQKIYFGQLERLSNMMLDLIESEKLSFSKDGVLGSAEDACQKDYWKKFKRESIQITVKLLTSNLK